MKKRSAESKLKSKSQRPMNRWVKEALERSGKTQEEIADGLINAAEAMSLTTKYNKSTVQKMTVDRSVLLDEAIVISRLTNYPLPRTLPRESLMASVDQLSESDRELIHAVVERIRVAGSQ